MGILWIGCVWTIRALAGPTYDTMAQSDRPSGWCQVFYQKSFKKSLFWFLQRILKTKKLQNLLNSADGFDTNCVCMFCKLKKLRKICRIPKILSGWHPYPFETLRFAQRSLQPQRPPTKGTSHILSMYYRCIQYVYMYHIYIWYIYIYIYIIKMNIFMYLCMYISTIIVIYILKKVINKTRRNKK